MVIKKKKDLKKHYEGKKVVDSYTDKRFTTPIGRFMHIKQVEIINKFIKKKKRY